MFLESLVSVVWLSLQWLLVEHRDEGFPWPHLRRIKSRACLSPWLTSHHCEISGRFWLLCGDCWAPVLPENIQRLKTRPLLASLIDWMSRCLACIYFVKENSQVDRFLFDYYASPKKVLFECLWTFQDLPWKQVLNCRPHRAQAVCSLETQYEQCSKRETAFVLNNANVNFPWVTKMLGEIVYIKWRF